MLLATKALPSAGQIRFAQILVGDATIQNMTPTEQAFIRTHWARTYGFGSLWNGQTWYRNPVLYRDFFAIYDNKYPGQTNQPAPDMSLVLNDAAPKAISNITRSGTTFTVTSTAHGLPNGKLISIFGVNHTFNVSPNSSWIVASVPDANTFTFTATGLSSGSYTSGGSCAEPLYIGFGTVNGGRRTQFAADFGSSAWQSVLFSDLNAIQNNGYVGFWLDDVNWDFTITYGDGTDASGTVYDPRTGTTMSLTNWRKYMADTLEYIRAQFPRSEIHINTPWTTGSSNHDLSDANMQRGVKAITTLVTEHGALDTGITGGTGGFSLHRYISFLDKVHTLGAGFWIFASSSDTGTATDAEYSLAAYLLVSNRKDLVTAKYNNLPSNWWSGYDVNLGTPLTSWSRSTTSGTIGLFRRDFSNGMVLLLEPGATTITNYNLGGTFYDIAGNPLTTVTLTGKSAKVLTGAAPTGGGGGGGGGPFPTTAVLDNGQRANENPISNGSKWSMPMISGYYNGQLLSNAITSAGTGWFAIYWNQFTSANVEVYGTITPTGSDFYLYWRVVNPGNASTMTAYFANFQPDADNIVFGSWSGTSATNISNHPATLNSGDTVGAKMVGTTLEFYVNGTLVANTADGTMTSAGYIGCRAYYNTGNGFTSFGGGAI